MTIRLQRPQETSSPTQTAKVGRASLDDSHFQPLHCCSPRDTVVKERSATPDTNLSTVNMHPGEQLHGWSGLNSAEQEALSPARCNILKKHHRTSGHHLIYAGRAQSIEHRQNSEGQGTTARVCEDSKHALVPSTLWSLLIV